MVDHVASRILEISAEGIREVSPSAFHDGQFLVEHGTYQQREAS